MALANYFIQANLYLVVFYLFYKLLLNKETYFWLNRFYLVSAVICSFLIPYLRLEWVRFQTVSQTVNININSLISKTGEIQQAGPDWQKVILSIYIAGALFSFLLLAYKLIRMKAILQHPVKGAAFSFFGYKIVDAGLPGYDTINHHEETHMKQLHSLDIILFELAGIFAWFNPVIYFYKLSIRDVHEYLADEAAAKYEGDTRKYALLLLNAAMGVAPAIGNPFIRQSLTKKRIFMLQKARSGKRTLLKYGLFMPLLAGMVIFSSATMNRGSSYTGARGADTKAEFPGGFGKFREYLQKATKYPAQALKDKIEGKVLVNFTVDTDGSVTDVKVAKGLGAGLDEEAVRLVQHSPKWRPGTVNGIPARVEFGININFSAKR